jgi:hypothetical protein
VPAVVSGSQKNVNVTIDDHVPAIPRVTAVIYDITDDRRMYNAYCAGIITIFPMFRTMERPDAGASRCMNYFERLSSIRKFFLN